MSLCHCCTSDRFFRLTVQRDVQAVWAMAPANTLTGYSAGCTGGAPLVAGLNIPMAETSVLTKAVAAVDNQQQQQREQAGGLPRVGSELIVTFSDFSETASTVE